MGYEVFRRRSMSNVSMPTASTGITTTLSEEDSVSAVTSPVEADLFCDLGESVTTFSFDDDSK